MTLVLNGTTGVSAVDGSASTPAIQGNDTNTGIFFPAADTIAFAEGGTEVMRIDSSGNVGIGTSAPAAKFMVAAGDSATALNQANISGGRSLGGSVYGSAGSLLFTNSFWAAGYGAASISGLDSGSSGGHLAFATTTNGGGTTGVPTERARIASSGNFAVGSTDPGNARIHSTSSGTTSATHAIYAQNSVATILFECRSDGAFSTGRAAVSPYNLTTGNAASVWVDSNGFLYRSTSSLKYKTDVQDATHGLAELLTLRPVTYKSNRADASGSVPDAVYGGLIAEEVHEAGLTEFVQYADDGTPDALSYGNMVSLCVKAIQEQQAIIEQLKADVAALKGAQA